MKYISTLLANLRPMQMFMSILLTAVMVFASGCTGASAKNTPTAETVQIENIKRDFPSVVNSDSNKGTVHLDKIEQNTEKALEEPATSLETIEERSKGALNEVQGTADRNKMNRSNGSK